MCGICGYAGIEDKQLIEEMKTRIKHRGPDGNGTYYNLECKLALGHQRLSIIDLSDLASQPMQYGKEEIYIVFNGEIYNYIEIKEELLKKGYKFETSSDTEVILAAYKEWGEECLQYFNGMFAFVIWDENKQQLFCARDRFGEKPFYYYIDETKKVFLFASEIKALLAYKEIETAPNDQIILDFLVQGVLEHSEQTFFKNIYKLPAAHFACLNVSRMHMSIKRYWTLKVSDKLTNEVPSSEVEVFEEFRQKLIKSINMRLRSDVAVGSCLSGGLDSSSIVLIVNQLLKETKLLSKQIGEQQKTFTFCSEDSDFDERNYVEEIVAVTNVEKNYIFASADDLIKELHKLVYYQEEPFLTSSIFAQWCIMKAVKSRGVKVLLDGQGADEILGGYRKYRIHLLKEYLRKGFFYKAIMELIAGLSQVKKSYNYNQDLVKISNMLGIKLKSQYLDYICLQLREKYQKNLVKPKNLSEALFSDMTRYSIPSLLRYEDKNSMAFSIESRVPYLDHELVEYVNTLPYNYKINYGWSKWLMRSAMKDILPERVRMRKDKMGFVTTEKIWFKEKANEFYELLYNAKKNDSFINNYINLDKVLNDFPKIIEGKIEVNLWRIISLTLWLDMYFPTPNLNRVHGD